MSTQPDRSPSLRFLGAAGTVTGSRFLLSVGSSRVLVDCGLFQGKKELRKRNWQPFPVNPATLDAVVLTHAHIDHAGYLPGLQRHGFRGRVLATRGTTELSRIVLPDSGRIHQEDAAYANRKGFSKHEPALPLYTEADALRVLDSFEVVPFDQELEAAPGIRVRLSRAGHILGSASVWLAVDGARPRSVFVSGDLGRAAHPILAPPDAPGDADAFLVESTYGDRVHDDAASVDALAEGVARTAGRGGVALIPAFAVDRTEIVLLHLRRLAEAGRIPNLPVYVDSPMALAALRVYRRAIQEGWDEIRPELRGQPAPFDAGDLIEVRDVADSKDLQRRRGPFIVVSASGMATGGRVLHHLRSRLPDASNSVILVGYQAVGTRGRRLLGGERALKMFGRYVAVKAEVIDLGGFSVHADGEEIVSWLGGAKQAPGVVFVVHGEPDASDALAGRIQAGLGWPAVVPADQEQVRL